MFQLTCGQLCVVHGHLPHGIPHSAAFCARSRQKCLLHVLFVLVQAHCYRKVRFGATNFKKNVDDEQIDGEDWKKVSENQTVHITDFIFDGTVKTAAFSDHGRHTQCSKHRQGHGRGEQ